MIPEGADFANRKEWSEWLHRHHATSSGVWVRLAKKGADIVSVTYLEAVEEALCYGWIDARKNGENQVTWLQRFTPRCPKSIWSKINRQKALVLIESGLIKPAGLREVERARADGRWEQAYDGSRNSAVPPDLEVALLANLKARRFFDTLDRGNRYAVLFRLQTAKKPDTRARLVEKFVAMLENEKKIHP